MNLADNLFEVEGAKLIAVALKRNISIEEIIVGGIIVFELRFLRDLPKVFERNMHSKKIKKTKPRIARVDSGH